MFSFIGKIPAVHMVQMHFFGCLVQPVFFHQTGIQHEPLVWPLCYSFCRILLHVKIIEHFIFSTDGEKLEQCHLHTVGTFSSTSSLKNRDGHCRHSGGVLRRSTMNALRCVRRNKRLVIEVSKNPFAEIGLQVKSGFELGECYLHTL